MSYFDYKGKKIFYREEGEGETCIFLHGNTASSKMFEYLLPLYINDFRVVLMDFSGNGRSERVERFPDEMWIDQGRQVIEMCRRLDCGRVNLIGASGGAYSAINAALERPELFKRVVADSFDGSRLHKGFAEAVINERKNAMADEAARGFYEWCQGGDWEEVVEKDTRALVNYERKNIRLFSAPIETIKVPLLITVSKQDEMLFNDMESECKKLSDKNANITAVIFDAGGHPLILSRAEDMASLIREYLSER